MKPAAYRGRSGFRCKPISLNEENALMVMRTRIEMSKQVLLEVEISNCMLVDESLKAEHSYESS